MKNVYVINNGMTKEQMFRLRLIDGFNFATITADAVLKLNKEFFRNDNCCTIRVMEGLSKVRQKSHAPF